MTLKYTTYYCIVHNIEHIEASIANLFYLIRTIQYPKWMCVEPHTIRSIVAELCSIYLCIRKSIAKSINQHLAINMVYCVAGADDAGARTQFVTLLCNFIHDFILKINCFQCNYMHR